MSTTKYRGIRLLDDSAKIFPYLLFNRSMAWCVKAGFRPARRCADQIFMLKMVLEYRFKYQQPTASLSILQLESDETDGVSKKIIRLIKVFFSIPWHRSVYLEDRQSPSNKNWCPSTLHSFPSNIQLYDRLDNGYCLSAFKRCTNWPRESWTLMMNAVLFGELWRNNAKQHSAGANENRIQGQNVNIIEYNIIRSW